MHKADVRLILLPVKNAMTLNFGLRPFALSTEQHMSTAMLNAWTADMVKVLFILNAFLKLHLVCSALRPREE